MEKLSDDWIEDAFREIRADFEERENRAGLEMLDGVEDGWAEYGRLTEKQIAWLEKQLSGSWRPKRKATASGVRAHVAKEPKRNIVQVPPSVAGLEQLLEAMLHQKFKEQGSVLVNLKRLNAIEAAIEDLQEAIHSLR